jgi:uncharacterized membrane protein YbhN (UPF0104 family)
VVGLLVSQARSVDWDEVFAAMRSLNTMTILAAAGLVMLSYFAHASFDLYGRALTSHQLSVPRVLSVSFVSYAFNLNFGALIGGMAFRYRLYSRLGLSAGDVTRILAMSVTTNWLGYLALSGVVLATGMISLPESWVAGGVLRIVGVVLLLVFAAYMVITALSRVDEITLRNMRVPVPSRGMALLQAGHSMLNWALLGFIVFLLMPENDAISYPVVLGTLLVAAIAGVISHVPAGLGVLEAVFVAVLGGVVPRGELLAAVLVYRALYYLFPLLVAGVVYAVTEAMARRKPAKRANPAPAPGS